MDDFTPGLLTNDEVPEVNQDPLGKQAARISVSGDPEGCAKEPEDGSIADREGRNIGKINRAGRDYSLPVFI